MENFVEGEKRSIGKDECKFTHSKRSTIIIYMGFDIKIRRKNKIKIKEPIMEDPQTFFLNSLKYTKIL